MKMNERMEAALKLAGDEAFNREAEGIQTAEEFQRLFAGHGVDLSIEEVEDLCAAIVNAEKPGELNENDLENVAGGFGFVLGLSIGLAVGAAAGYVYAKSKRR